MSHKATVFDVAAYILKKTRPCTHMKLQKLLYYAQAWSLVWDEKPIFADRVEAWANGPVVPRIFQQLKGKYSVAASDLPTGDPGKLTDEQIGSVNAVLEYYANRSPQWLSDLTHAEHPWRDARHGLPPGERGSKEITRASMAEYYGSL